MAEILSIMKSFKLISVDNTLTHWT